MQAFNLYLTQWGWAVLDSLWQFGVLYLIYAGIRYAAGRHLRAAHAYWLLLVLLCSGAAIFVFNILQPVTGGGYSPLLSQLDIPAIPPSWLQYLLVATGIVYVLISGIRIGLFAVRLLRPFGKEAFVPHSLGADFETYFTELCAWLRISMPVIRFSSSAITPYVTGFFRHVIVIPVSLLNQLTQQETEAVILHELAHIKRGDAFTNLLVLVVEQLLWFNPFVRELTGQLRQQREMACDDRVLDMGVKPLHYATSLHKVAVYERQPAAWQLAMSVQKGELMHRVERLFKKHPYRPFQLKTRPFLALPFVLLALIFLGRKNEGVVMKGQSLNKAFAVAPQIAELPAAPITNSPAAAATAKYTASLVKKPVRAKMPAVTQPIDAPLVESELPLIPAATRSSQTAYTTFINEGSHRSQDVIMKFTDSVLVFENYISRANMESSTGGHLVKLLNVIAGVNEALAANPETLRLIGTPAGINVSQNGAPNLFFNNAVLQHEAVYNPSTKEWRIHFTLLNNEEKLGERFVTIYRKQTLQSASF